MLDTASLLFWTTTTGVLSALATGLGAIPVHFVQRDSHLVRAFSSAIAAGMMISASVFSLAQEGINLKYRIPNAPYIVILGLLLGAAFFWLTERFISDHPLPSHPFTKDFSKGILIFIAMFIPRSRRIAIGVGFATGNFQFGMVMAMAISVHNIPEGSRSHFRSKPKGLNTKMRRCRHFNQHPQPVMAVPALS